MAFQNYLSESLYTVIDDVSYEKNNKAVSFSLNVYSDSTKEYLVAHYRETLNCYRAVQELEDINYKVAPSDSFETEVKFGAAPSDCEGSWLGMDGYVASFDPTTQQWGFSGPTDPYYYCKADQKFYKNTSSAGGEWVEVKNPPCTLTWEKFFSASVISKEGTNLYKQIYLWLKSQPEFESAESI